MRTAYAVIGANYGDEGKGLIVDKICRDVIAGGQKPLVIRHNGTAQAAHTVCRRNSDGTVTEHVFSHFGSGTLAGVPTVLADTFYLHPAALYQEHLQLAAKKVFPKLYFSRKSPIVIPSDIAINRILERRRQKTNAQHGSCGLGMYEAFRRENAGVHLNLWNYGENYLGGGKGLSGYYQARMMELGVSKDELYGVFDATGIAEMFRSGIELLNYCDDFLPVSDVVHAANINSPFALVFEGAQGLGLDPSIGTMPHCTPSACGIQNPAKIVNQFRDMTLAPVYVTRTYQSRHGAGPFPPSSAVMWPWEHFKRAPAEFGKHDTNKPNAWQNSIRYAPLDVGTVSRMARDLDHLRGYPRLKVELGLAVTWLDVVTCPDAFKDMLIDDLCVASGRPVDLLYASHGRFASDAQFIKRDTPRPLPDQVAVAEQQQA